MENLSCFVLNVPHHHSHISSSFLCAGLKRLVLLPPNCRGFLCIHCEWTQCHQPGGPFIHKLATWRSQGSSDCRTIKYINTGPKKFSVSLSPFKWPSCCLFCSSTKSSLHNMWILEIYQLRHDNNSSNIQIYDRVMYAKSYKQEQKRNCTFIANTQ